MIRSALTGAPPIVIARQVAKGKAALETSSGVAAARMSRARGPISDSTAKPEVTSTRLACIPSGMLRSIHEKSCVAKPVPVTM